VQVIELPTHLGGGAMQHARRFGFEAFDTDVGLACVFGGLLLGADIDAPAVGEENLDDAQIANSLARNGSVFGGIGRKCQDRCLAATCPRIGIECLAEVLRIAIQLPRKHKLPAFGCGKLGTVNAGAQQEAFRCCWRKRGRMRTFVSGIGSKIGIDVGQLLGKVRLSGWVAAHLEGAGRERKAARRLNIILSACRSRAVTTSFAVLPSSAMITRPGTLLGLTGAGPNSQGNSEQRLQIRQSRQANLSWRKTCPRIHARSSIVKS
jgi:hypothetical protein